MTKDDFLRDQTERELRDATRRRRDGRSRRRSIYVIGGLTLIGLLILGGPSIVCHSSIGRSVLSKTLADYGFNGGADTMRIGWVTPLQLTGLNLTGTAAGSTVRIDRVDMDMTVTDVIADMSFTQLGQMTLRGVRVAATIDEGRSSIEDDLAVLLAPTPDDQPSAGVTGNITVQDFGVTITDAVTSQAWQVGNCNADVEMTPAEIRATFAGVLTEPASGGHAGDAGSLTGSMELAMTAAADESAAWKINVKTESLPLSVVALGRRRMPELASSIPRRVGGDATGAVVLYSAPNGNLDASIGNLQIRNLTAEDEAMLGQAGTRMWRNSLATVDGELTLTDTRLYGRRLQATTDFARATMDGVLSTTFSLTGDDNPMRWLEAIDGTATAEVDLAKLDAALPGILPLRDGAELVSGRAVAKVESSPSGNSAAASVHRSILTLQSDSLRARASGRAVVIDPIELSAIVATGATGVRAEHFAFKSAFGAAVGQGDLRSGNADIDIDFGRLTAMLRPIVDISATSLAGAAKGQIKWNATPDNVWRLSGGGEASNLAVTLPDGQMLRRQAMRAEVAAVGRWGGQSLDELSSASVTVTTGGLDARAKLMGAVANPQATTPMPVAIEAVGRLETLTELLAPWMPAELTEATGGFTLDVGAEVSTGDSRLTRATLALTQPRVIYAETTLTQPAIEVVFAGDALYPATTIRADTLTVAGEAFSAAAKGTASLADIDMQMKWRAKLERLQNSVQTRVAGPSRTPVQTVATGGPSVAADAWLVRGDCEGDLAIKTQIDSSPTEASQTIAPENVTWLLVSSKLTGRDVAVVQPASASLQTVGPMPASMSPPRDVAGEVVWAEPNVRLDGDIRYNMTTGDVIADAVQVAGDWFATTLSGTVAWNETVGQVKLSGPARLKMDEVANRLSPLAGIPIRATGVHETSVDIQANRRPDGDVGLAIAADLGWESSEVAGLVFGPTRIPIQMTETTVTVLPARVAVGPPGDSQGALNLAGRVNYRPGPMWMQVERGVIADNIRLTPELTDRWLKYLAPMAANTARIQGTISAELDEATIVFDNPQQSRIVGRLNLGGVEMNAGPLAEQLIVGVDQLKSLAGTLLGKTVDASQNRTLITMPPQTVDFAVDRGVVVHERMFFEIDRAQIITSGRVAFDNRINMTAQIPLDPRWLGRDLQGLAGQSVTLPIDGTLSRPSLDSAGVRQVVTQLGTQAIQQNAESYLQKQLGKQIEKIGLDKIFGR